MFENKSNFKILYKIFIEKQIYKKDLNSIFHYKKIVTESYNDILKILNKKILNLKICKEIIENIKTAYKNLELENLKQKTFKKRHLSEIEIYFLEVNPENFEVKTVFWN